MRDRQLLRQRQREMVQCVCLVGCPQASAHTGHSVRRAPSTTERKTIHPTGHGAVLCRAAVVLQKPKGTRWVHANNSRSHAERAASARPAALKVSQDAVRARYVHMIPREIVATPWVLFMLTQASAWRSHSASSRQVFDSRDGARGSREVLVETAWEVARIGVPKTETAHNTTVA